ncbi:MAG: hypothetical protein PWP04_489 [Candidatus Atribacteria bacterium]|nr:hypothetical protein [Candidatus Atribacteria bacterium]
MDGKLTVDVRSRYELEQGISLLSKGGKFSFGLCFPENYVLGMANLGFQTILNQVFELPEWRVERFFLDTGNRSLETGTPLSSFLAIGFSLPYELAILNVISMLREANIPLFYWQRSEIHPWVIFGGPSITLNPEVYAPFADILTIGEGESLIGQVLQALEKDQDRGQTKEMLSGLAGVYLPESITPQYQGRKLLSFAGKGVSLPVTRQKVNLGDFPGRTVLYSPISYFRETALLEISRGCSFRCRFCAGGAIYHPFRYRPLDQIKTMVSQMDSWSSKVGLVGSDILGHPEIKAILSFLLKRGKKVTFSSLSLRRLLQDDDLLPLVVAGGAETLTLAPETGSDHCRAILGKSSSKLEWIELVRWALRKGVSKIKLYLMLGLPWREVEEDLTFLSELVEKTGGKGKITVSYSFFVPKPHTLFEQVRTPSFKEWKKEKARLEKEAEKIGITLTGESARLAWLQLIVARGDRCLGEKLATLEENRPWSLSKWRIIMEELERDFEEWPRQPEWEETLPWDTVDFDDGWRKKDFNSSGMVVNGEKFNSRKLGAGQE